MKKLQRTSLGFAALALVAALPAGAQTSPITVQAESMKLTSYVVETGNRIKLSAANGSASTTFSGATGTYDIQVFVVAESDGQSTLDVFKDATKLGTYTYPRSAANATYTIKGASLTKGQTIRLDGHANGGAWARVDRIVFTPVAAPVASVKTIEAESMTLGSYAVENGVHIKLTAATGSATATFNGVAGNYKLQVFAIPENDGQSQLDVLKNGTKWKTFTYPRTTAPTTFTLDSIALAPNDSIRLVGRANGGAWARVDKIVLTPTTLPPLAADGSTTPAGGGTSTPSATTACANPSGGYEGFAKNTTGGAGKTVYRVKNLNDSGAGSLRDALSAGNRCVVFDVGGTISLASHLVVRGGNVTIDGLTAPSPGITLKDRTLIMQGASGANNIVVRGIRSRGTPLGEDAIRVFGASNIVLDRISVSGFGDGAIDITEKSRDVAIQWSILGDGNPVHNFPSLIKYDAARISVHHNLYAKSENRNPHCGGSDTATSLAPEIVCDVRNNLIWNFTSKGTEVRTYGTANVINNYYYTSSTDRAGHSIYVSEGGSAYVSGNYSKNGAAVNSMGNRATPYSATAPTTTDAVTAARQVLAKAGARGPRFGLDAKDQAYMDAIKID